MKLLFYFQAWWKAYVFIVDTFQTLISISMLLLFAAESDRVCFGRERPTDANEQTARREHGKLNSRSVGLFSQLVLLFFNVTIALK